MRSHDSRWMTVEFIGHYLMIGQAVFFGVKSVLKMSSPHHPAYNGYKAFLSDGWIPGKKIDLSDHQYGGFRNHLPSLTGFMVLYVLISRYLNKHKNLYITSMIGIAYVVVLHGFNTAKIGMIILVNYAIARHASNRYRPFLTWAFGLLVLFVTEWFDLPFFPKSLWTGVYERWNVVFKIAVLRMISFNMDYHWLDSQQDNRLLHKQNCQMCLTSQDCHKYETQFGCLDKDDYDWPKYLAYLLYPPLYIAGPILTFNAFMHQTRNVNRPNSVQYGLRLLSCIILLDVMLHYCHVVAIKNTQSFDGMTALDYGMIGYFNLKIIWLKLLIIWRYFRFFALLDGYDAPENMIRCMTNNYSGMAFWRSWHRSFYLWIVRYLYIPLGGSKTVVWNMWPVFSFVAVWHDLRLHLFAWSWLICLFFIPEITAKWVSHRLAMEKWHSYRQLSGMAAAVGISMMMIANLVGFAVGVSGMKIMLKEIVTWKGTFFCTNAFLTMYSAAQVMFEVRAEERRRGIFNNF